MALIIEKPTAVFDLSQIQPGYLFYGRHSAWAEGKSGIVTAATDNQLTVQYHPGIGNVTNHFIVLVPEAVAGEWDIKWSADLSEVFTYGGQNSEPGKLKEPGEPGETEGSSNESGRTDL